MSKVSVPLISRPPANNLLELLRLRAENESTDGGFRFLEHGETDVGLLSFAELDRRARAFAAELQASCAPGERALLLYPPGSEFLVGLFACFYAGVIAVPAYPPRNPRHAGRIRALQQDSAASLVLATSEVRERTQDRRSNEEPLLQLPWIVDPPAPTNRQLSAWHAPTWKSDDLALLQYTSGSTSQPKGVRLTHRNLLHNLQAMAEAVSQHGQPRFVSWLPPYHDMGLIGNLLGAVYTDSELTILPPVSFLQKPLRWLQAISKYRATVSGAPNFAYELCVRRIQEEDKAELDLSCWELAFNGAERVHEDTLRRFSEAFADCGFSPRSHSPCYGLAESTLCVSMTPANDSPRSLEHEGRSLVSTGRIVPGMEVEIVEPQSLRICAEGEVGEIWVRGPSVAEGYWTRNEAQADPFTACLPDADPDDPPYLRTGDLGFLQSGELFIAGRLKDLLILQGRNFHPEDLEHTVQNAHSGLRPFGGAAFAIEVDRQERLVIAQELESLHGVDRNDAVHRIREAIAQEYELPVHAVALLPPGACPKTSSGKVQRGECRKLYESGQLKTLVLDRNEPMTAQASESVATDSEFEVHVLDSMREVLGLPSLSSHDNFFDFGGHSLMATQVHSRLRDHLGLDLPLRWIFEAQTAHALAERIRHRVHPGLDAPPIRRIPRDGALPLTFSQERMWYLHQLDPQSSAYNVCGSLRIEGPLDVDAMRAAIQHCCNRHEILRARYGESAGKPVQEIRAAMPLEIPCEDLSAVEQPEQTALENASQLARQAFDLEADPLLRAKFFRIAEQDHVLAVSMHHIIADGWSVGIVLREMITIYTALRAGTEPELAANEIGYVDYAAWQRSWLESETLNESTRYWLQVLKPTAPPLELPFDRRPALNSPSSGRRCSMLLDDDLIAELHQLGQRHGATLFMVLLASYKLLLNRCTGQTDIAVGVPIANRNWLSSEHLVGTLVNTVVMRNQIDGDPRFTSWLEQVRETALAAYAHQDVPFERIIELLQLERQDQRTPLIQTLFDYQKVPIPDKTAGELRVRPIFSDRGGSQFDLSLFVFDAGGQHEILLEYDDHCFEAATAERLLEQYVQLLRTVVARPDAELSTLEWVPPAEQQRLLAEGRHPAPEIDLETPAIRMFEDRVREDPSRPAVVFEDSRLSYGELDALSEQLSTSLLSHSVRPTERIAVCVERSLDWPVAWLGVHKASAAYVPIDPAYPADRIAQVLEDAAPKVIVTQPHLAARLRELSSTPLIELDTEDERQRIAPATSDDLESSKATRSRMAPNDPAYVLFTSGSTGRPKGVRIPQRALSNFLQSMQRKPGLRADDRLLSVTTPAFDISGLEIYLPLVSGAQVEIARDVVAQDGKALREHLEASDCTIMQATPATWRSLIDAGWQGAPDLKMLCGGEALPRELADRLLEHGAELWNLYGPTETTIWSTVERVRRGQHKISIGRPIHNTDVYVLDCRLEPVPFGVVGELYIGGAGVATGYLHRPELTAAKFVEDPFSSDPEARLFRTGDAVRRMTDGRLEFLGRLDHQVKLRGYRIELGEVESHLNRHAAVTSAVAVVREDRPGDQRLVAYFTTETEANVDTQELHGCLQRQLPGYMVPAHLVRLDQFPLTPNGKLNRAALPRPPLATAARSKRLNRPLTSTERQLADIWKEVLGREYVRATDSFFDLGGHSLLAVQMFSRLQDRFGIRLALSELFTAATIEALAKRVREELGEELPDGLIAIQPKGKHPPLFWVHALGGGEGTGLMRYRNVAEGLGENQPSFGLQDPEHPFSCLEDMAASYADRIRAFQPKGPYQLAGYCFGGNVAQEIARQLERGGESVSLLALIDASLPGNGSVHSAWNPVFWAKMAGNLPAWFKNLARRSSDERRSYFERRLRYWFRRARWNASFHRRVPELETVVDLESFSQEARQTARAHWQALYGHEPKPCRAPITLIRARHQGLLPRFHDMGWGRLSTKRVDVHTLATRHGDFFTDQGCLELARILRPRLIHSEQQESTHADSETAAR